MAERELYKLRREDHGIGDRAVMEALLESALVGRVGVLADGEPYVVPMNFAYHNSKIYIHGSNQGRLMKSVQKNPKVCFEIDEYVATLPHPVLCEFDTAYASVLCFGTARILSDLGERIEALKIIASKYATPKQAAALRESTVEQFRGQFEAHTAMIEIEVEVMTGKKQDFNVQDFDASDDSQYDKHDLSALGNVPESYFHHERVVSNGRPLEVENGLLKWYDIRRPEVIIPPEYVRDTRNLIKSEAEKSSFELPYGLGFVLLHYSDQLSYLIICYWNEYQELWQQKYSKKHDEQEFRTRMPGIDSPTFCVWELAPVCHERDAWVRFLNSNRDKGAKSTYLSDVCSGLY